MRYRFTRRGFLKGVAGAAGLAMVRCAPAASLPAPPDFPSTIELRQELFQNWAGDISVDDVWTASPRTPEEVVAIANWAHAHGWRVRAKGHSHNWSPLTLMPGSSGAGVLLVDTVKHLTAMSIDRSGTPATVTAQAGVSLHALLEALSAEGLGMHHHPAPGDLTLGGVLAIAGHGTAVPAAGERAIPGKTFGSVSNQVLAMTAVIWDPSAGAYALARLTRDDPRMGALLVHLGRAFVVEATLQVGADVNLRCRSTLEIGAGEMFAPPSRAGDRSFARILGDSGRVETILLPFMERPWLKVWTIEPSKPASCTAVTAPYNYAFANAVTEDDSRAITRDLLDHLGQTPLYMAGFFNRWLQGLRDVSDLWGAAHLTQLYVGESTLRVTSDGHVVLCAASSVQRVVSEAYEKFSSLTAEYQRRGQYPINNSLEIRVTGVERPADVAVPGAALPLLSPVCPRADRPEWDRAVYIANITMIGTPHQNDYYADWEAWLYASYTGAYAAIRPEWTKGWAYTSAGPWTNAAVLASAIPESFDAGSWRAALAALDEMDPHRLFTSPMLDRLMPA